MLAVARSAAASSWASSVVSVTPRAPLMEATETYGIGLLVDDGDAGVRRRGEREAVVEADPRGEGDDVGRRGRVRAEERDRRRGGVVEVGGRPEVRRVLDA